MLPPQLTPKHHILFTFHHVSVEQPKESKEKKKEILTPVGYSWLPILTNHIVIQDESFLPVASFLPEGYLTKCNIADVMKNVSTDIKWADGKGQNLFKVNTKLVSTIYTQVILGCFLLLDFNFYLSKYSIYNISWPILMV